MNIYYLWRCTVALVTAPFYSSLEARPLKTFRSCLVPHTFLNLCHIKKNLTILEYQIKFVYKIFLTAEC